jgi:hypothetical protein
VHKLGLNDLRTIFKVAAFQHGSPYLLLQSHALVCDRTLLPDVWPSNYQLYRNPCFTSRSIAQSMPICRLTTASAMVNSRFSSIQAQRIFSVCMQGSSSASSSNGSTTWNRRCQEFTCYLDSTHGTNVLHHNSPNVLLRNVMQQSNPNY